MDMETHYYDLALLLHSVQILGIFKNGVTF